MVVLGNILLGIAALVYLIFAAETFGRPMPGGDAGVGAAWALILTHAVFFVAFALVSAIIALRGGFAWVASSGTMRFVLVAGGLLLAVGGSLFLNAKEGPVMRGVLGQLAGLLLPMLTIAGLALLLNRPAPVSTLLKLPLLLAVGLGALTCAPFVFISLKARVEGNISAVKSIGQPDSNELRMIQDVEKYDVSKGVGSLLIYTDYNKHRAVREPALAKIKSAPDWQQQLADGLRTGWASEVFTFLASNDVEDKSLFADPLHDGIHSIADLIREKIGNAYQEHHLYEGQFLWETERVLRTLKQFEGNGENYRPDMQVLRAAFDTPCKTKKPKFVCVRFVDDWLKAH